jgi:hypothetical protein
MAVRHIVLRARDVVFFKGIIEANEGLASVFAEHGGDLLVASPVDRERELDSVLEQVCGELAALRVRQ